MRGSRAPVGDRVVGFLEVEAVRRRIGHLVGDKGQEQPPRETRAGADDLPDAKGEDQQERGETDRADGAKHTGIIAQANRAARASAPRREEESAGGAYFGSIATTGSRCFGSGLKPTPRLRTTPTTASL